MNVPYCWHRPGPVHRAEVHLCRYCRVAVEECPCVSFGRTPEPQCRCCEGSGWVGILRGRAGTVLGWPSPTVSWWGSLAG